MATTIISRLPAHNPQADKSYQWQVRALEAKGTRSEPAPLPGPPTLSSPLEMGTQKLVGPAKEDPTILAHTAGCPPSSHPRGSSSVPHCPV